MAGTVRWSELAAEARERFTQAGLSDAPQAARWIVEEASGHEGVEYAAGLSQPATERGVAAFDAMVARRLAGEPLQYVLGRWGFRTLDLAVDRRVLIPRPETEQVVGWALDGLDRLAADIERPLVVADLGTGSGAIALSIAAERRGTTVWATDVSAAALEVARSNLAGLGTAGTGVRLAAGSWFAALPAALRGRLDAVVSNPPYVAADEALPPEVAEWEPPGALVSGPTGLESLLHLVATAPQWLARPGVLVLELAPDQADAVRHAAAAAGFTDARVEDDHAGRHRAVVARVR